MVTKYSSLPGPIGIFDSGYGGLTVFDKIRERMPAYDYIYLGDNARAPYGPRSFDVKVVNWSSWLVIRLRQRLYGQSSKGTCPFGMKHAGCWALSVRRSN